MAPDTDPAAILARIKERSHLASGLWDSETCRRSPVAAPVAESAMDVPLLAGALEAVLKRHRKQEKPVRTHNACPKHAGWMSSSGHLFRTAVELCPDCTLTEKYVCVTCRHECPDDDEWPCAEYQAITAKLTGKDAPK
jgi:hypothetical protein